MSVAPHRTQKWSLSKEESLEKTVAPSDPQIPRQKVIEKNIIGKEKPIPTKKERETWLGIGTLLSCLVMLPQGKRRKENKYIMSKF